MDESSAKKKSTGLATVAEHGPSQDRTPRDTDPVAVDSDAESHSGSVVEKSAASGSGSTSSEELLYLDDSVAAAKPKGDPLTASSPFGAGRSAKLPPRAPVSPGDPDVEGVLPSQPSIVRRMQEANKHDVDPKDARALLPSVLLNSGSLDLDGVYDGLDSQNASRVAEKKLQEEALLNLLRQKELENLYLAQQQQQRQQELLLAAQASRLDLGLLTSALNDQCRVSPPGFPQFGQQQQQQELPSNNFMLHQMLNRPRHGRSVSDPTFAFAGALNSMPPPFPQTPVDPVATTPLVDQTDALAFLSRSNLGQQQDWTPPTDLQQLQPSLGALLTVPQNPNAAMQPPEMPAMETSPPHRRRKHGPSKSVDFNLMMKQNKTRNSGTVKDRHLPMSPPTGSTNKSTTRAEVKKMVEYQARLGRPTYAPWFRDRSSRNNTPREGDGPQEMPCTHNRTQSLPHVNTTPRSPQKSNSHESQQPTPKSSRAGTGVFFPRMPVPN